MRFRNLALSGLFVACAAFEACATDWITAPSYYTHDPQSGERVRQYSPIGPFYINTRNDLQTSGYRHTRSSIQAGQSADHLHVVQRWGQPIRPYGEWRFPYRPNSVPYYEWGPPYVGLGPNFNNFGRGVGFGSQFPQPVPYGNNLQPGHAGRGIDPNLFHDGRYLPQRTRRKPDYLFYNPPMPGSQFVRPPGHTPPPAPSPPVVPPTTP